MTVWALPPALLGGAPRALWPGSRAEMASFWFTEKCYPKATKWEAVKEHVMSCTGPCAHLHPCAPLRFHELPECLLSSSSCSLVTCIALGVSSLEAFCSLELRLSWSLLLFLFFFFFVQLFQPNSESLPGLQGSSEAFEWLGL